MMTRANWSPARSGAHRIGSDRPEQAERCRPATAATGVRYGPNRDARNCPQLRRPTREESDYALKRIHNTWDDGGAYALLGPSGCGKTTLLNVISGLLTPSKGRVFYDGQDVTDLPPEKRNIAQVFQFPVLYDTMSVFDNLAFPLRNRRVAPDEIKRRVLEVAEILDLTPFLKKKAAGLAADAKQKISLGRGLVRSDVAAILFDEPLTVIDPAFEMAFEAQAQRNP